MDVLVRFLNIVDVSMKMVNCSIKKHQILSYLAQDSLLPQFLHFNINTLDNIDRIDKLSNLSTILTLPSNLQKLKQKLRMPESTPHQKTMLPIRTLPRILINQCLRQPLSNILLILIPLHRKYGWHAEIIHCHVTDYLPVFDVTVFLEVDLDVLEQDEG